MATCIFCGAQIPDDAKFCTACGAALPVEAAAVQEPIEVPAQVVAEQPAAEPFQQPAYAQPQPDAQQPYQQVAQQSFEQPQQAYQQPQQQYQPQYQRVFFQPFQTRLRRRPDALVAFPRTLRLRNSDKQQKFFRIIVIFCLLSDVSPDLKILKQDV